MNTINIDEAFETMMSVMGNQSSGNVVEFLERLKREHRTHQQTFWRNVRTMAELYQFADHDGRNEGAVEFTENVSKINTSLPYV